jgi:signal transduction histidine kinase
MGYGWEMDGRRTRPPGAVAAYHPPWQMGSLPCEATAFMWVDRAFRSIRQSWVDIAWVVFVGLNLIAMRLIPSWQTIPFLVIWVSLTAIYGFRLWRVGSTMLTVAAVTLATGGLIGVQVLQGQEDAEYLVEVPLLAMMVVVMVWHARRRLVAMEETKRVSDRNRRLLDQQRQFLQNASHELGTPITVALGHTQLIERAATDTVMAEDARVAVDELFRLRRLASRMLLLASADQPDFVVLAPLEVGELAFECLSRWSHVARRWSLEVQEDSKVDGDRDRLTLALDALIENAIDHTEVDDRIELSVHQEGSGVVLAVADSGSGIPATEVGRIFDRFSRADPGRSRQAGGFGLGLAIAKAVAEAHHGSVRVQSTVGQGSVFELVLPGLESRIGLGLRYKSAKLAESAAPKAPVRWAAGNEAPRRRFPSHLHHIDDA